MRDYIYAELKSIKPKIPRQTYRTMNRYGKAAGLAVICGQVFREKPKKHRQAAIRGREPNGMSGTD